MNMNPQPPVTLQLGHLPIETGGTPPPRPGHFEIGMSGWSGWSDSAPDESEVREHYIGDGQIRGLRRTGARRIIIDADIQASTEYGPGSVSDAVHQLGRLYRSTLTVTERDWRTTELDVIVEHRSTLISPLYATLTLTLTAADPLRHGSGVTRLYAGETWIPNRGDRQAWPILEAGGPVTFTVDHPGGHFRVSLPAGMHTIDTREGKIWTPSGTELAGTQASGPWPYVRPGGSLWDVGGFVTGYANMRRWEAWS